MTAELCFMPARQLAGMIRDREISCTELLEAHLGQIERFNPTVNAIVTEVAENARAAAVKADECLSRGESQGPLHGLPVAHKDLFETKGIRTTWGSPLHRTTIPARSTLIVDRLQAAGAITIGKTNTPEFGAGSQTHNSVFGATANPWDVTRTCGGSSGGAAVALACGMVPLADGSDLGGSLRNPASFCNVVGFRPSPGVVPAWPAQLGWDTLGVHGPMARSVDDIAFMLTAIAGPDSRAPVSLPESSSRFSEDLNANLSGLRVAWSDDLGGLPVEPAVTNALRQSRSLLQSLGGSTCDAEPDLTGAEECFQILRAWMFATRFAGEWPAISESMKDTVVWNIEQGMKLSATDVGRAEAIRTDIHQRVISFFEEYDVLALPVVQVEPFGIDVPWPRTINGTPMNTYIDWMQSCSLISVTGLPAISVPAGFTESGLPVGLQLVGGWRQDLKLLQVAHAFELAAGVSQRRAPIVTSDG